MQPGQSQAHSVRKTLQGVRLQWPAAAATEASSEREPATLTAASAAFCYSHQQPTANEACTRSSCSKLAAIWMSTCHWRAVSAHMHIVAHIGNVHVLIVIDAVQIMEAVGKIQAGEKFDAVSVHLPWHGAACVHISITTCSELCEVTRNLASGY